MKLTSLFPLGFGGFFVLGACGDSFGEAPAENGVDDVRLACEIRATWQHRSAVACSDCIAVAQAPKCDCPAYQQDYAARCAEQARARATEPSCDPTYDCVGKCEDADCGCVEACYAGLERCRLLSDAVEGCVAAVCDSYCR